MAREHVLELRLSHGLFNVWVGNLFLVLAVSFREKDSCYLEHLWWLHGHMLDLKVKHASLFACKVLVWDTSLTIKREQEHDCCLHSGMCLPGGFLWQKDVFQTRRPCLKPCLKHCPPKHKHCFPPNRFGVVQLVKYFGSETVLLCVPCLCLTQHAM